MVLRVPHRQYTLLPHHVSVACCLPHLHLCKPQLQRELVGCISFDTRQDAPGALECPRISHSHSSYATAPSPPSPKPRSSGALLMPRMQKQSLQELPWVAILDVQALAVGLPLPPWPAGSACRRASCFIRPLNDNGGRRSGAPAGCVSGATEGEASG